MAGALERLKAACEGKQRGFRGPKGEQQFVEVLASDLAEVCGGVPQPDAVLQVLLSAARQPGKPTRTIFIQADDCCRATDAAAGVPVPAGG